MDLEPEEGVFVPPAEEREDKDRFEEHIEQEDEVEGVVEEPIATGPLPQEEGVVEAEEGKQAQEQPEEQPAVENNVKVEDEEAKEAEDEQDKNEEGVVEAEEPTVAESKEVYENEPLNVPKEIIAEMHTDAIDQAKQGQST